MLAVQTEILTSHHRLTSDAINLHEYRQVFVARSLIDAMIGELLADAGDGLSRPDPGLRIAGRGRDEIIRSARRRLRPTMLPPASKLFLHVQMLKHLRIVSFYL